MQSTKNQLSDSAVRIEHVLNHIPPRQLKPAAYLRREIIRDGRELLTAEEQRICDMATD